MARILIDRIIDRRQDPKQKSLGNRQRFVQRSKEQVRKAVTDAIASGKIKDLSTGKGGKVTIKRTEEPSFGYDRLSGRKRFVLPGNKEFKPGDQIPIPQEGGSGGQGTQGSPDGEGEDEFTFNLTKEEFMDIYLGDLKLPNLVKVAPDKLKLRVRSRAGFSKTGSPATLDKERTMINSIGRRIGLGRPSEEEIKALEDKIVSLQEMEDFRTELDDAELAKCHELLIIMKKKRKRIPYLEPEIDPAYRRYEFLPKPTTQAVMFCLMDKSASMTEPLKDLAKRFFMLLHVFLLRFYKEVHIVFVAHTSEAAEVDEHTFFHGTETGGTVISTALEEMLKIIKERYDPVSWNIYAAQASDGDNFGSDMAKCKALLTEGPQALLKMVQYFAYVETLQSERGSSDRETPVWAVYKEIRATHENFRMKMVASPDQIYPVFHDLFSADKDKK